jgi:hydroxymethylpyrimidine pyrophosphatase-like HAD family hydrolase
MSYIVVDLHGTVIDKKNKPIPEAVEILKKLGEVYQIIFASGRVYTNAKDMKKQRDQIKKLGVAYNAILLADDRWKDQNNEGKIKLQLVEQYCGNDSKNQIVFFYDNNKKCCKYYHKKGYVCLKPKYIK